MSMLQHRMVSAFEGLLREMLVTTALLALPIVTLAALVGAAIAIVQAATQIQEQTMTLLPKMLAVGIAVALFGGFGMRLCMRLFADAISAIPQLIRG
ncbi:MAG TPA: flagellar biosynthetic protein FliQ [Candidatus Tyrphobacter sp.]